MNYKASFLLVLVCLAFAALAAQTESWEWAQSAGGNLDDSGLRVAAQPGGPSYTAGTFSDTLDFGTFSLISGGDEDIFIAKADPDGNWLWARQAGGTSSEVVKDIALDPAGNICLAGIFYDTITLGDTTLECPVDPDTLMWHDVFIAKMDPAGNWLWAKQAGGIYADDAGGLGVDALGNIFLAGTFMDTAAFGDSVLTSFGGCDIFAAKMDPDGNWLWANQAGSIEENIEFPFIPMGDFCLDMALDSAGNTYVTGVFVGTANFGDTSVTSAGGNDIFVGKLDPAGNWLWSSQAGGQQNNWGQRVCVDSDDNAYICGTYIENAIFGDHILNSVVPSHAQPYAAKLNTAGIWQWAAQATAHGLVSAGGIAADPGGNILLTGYFTDQAIFGETVLTYLGGTDVYLAKLDANGNWSLALSAGGTGDDKGEDIRVAGNDIFLTGMFSDNAMFGDYSLSSLGMADAFVVKLTQSTPVLDPDQGVPAAFALGQNSPNPFTKDTVIPLKIDSPPGRHTLCVYDFRGRRVAKLVDGPLSPGEHEISWDGRDAQNRPLPSGVYFYKLQSPSGSSVRKMILIK